MRRFSQCASASQQKSRSPLVYSRTPSTTTERTLKKCKKNGAIEHGSKLVKQLLSASLVLCHPDQNIRVAM
eukprot:5418197-Amphidinium_carterae.1